VNRALACALALSAAGAAAHEGPFFVGPAPKAAPRRVVTLAPSLTDCVVALGEQALLVGVSRFDELPAVSKLPRVGGFVDPSVEAVLELHPDLVVVQPAPGNQAPVEKLGELGLSVLVLPMHHVAQVETALEALGKALGVPTRGAALAAELERVRQSVRSRAARLRHPRVLFIYDFEPLVVAGPGSFADELLRDAGGVNVVEQAASPYPVYSPESALAARPDLIVDAAEPDARREAVRGLAPFRSVRWAALPSRRLLHPGPELGAGLEELFALFQGERDGGR